MLLLLLFWITCVFNDSFLPFNPNRLNYITNNDLIWTKVYRCSIYYMIAWIMSPILVYFASLIPLEHVIMVLVHLTLVGFIVLVQTSIYLLPISIVIPPMLNLIRSMTILILSFNDIPGSLEITVEVDWPEELESSNIKSDTSSSADREAVGIELDVVDELEHIGHCFGCKRKWCGPNMHISCVKQDYSSTITSHQYHILE